MRKITGFLKLMMVILLTVLTCGLFEVAAADEPAVPCPVSIVWDDNDNLYKRRPTSVRLYYTAEGKTGKDVQLSERYGWTGSIQLQLRDPKTLEYIDWNIGLSQYDSFQHMYDMECVFDDATRSYTVTFTFRETMSITADITFSDLEDMLGKRPSAEEFKPTLTIKPYKNGVNAASYTTGPAASVVDSGNGYYTVTWNDIPTVYPEFDGDADTASDYDNKFVAYLNTNNADYLTNVKLNQSPINGSKTTATTSIVSDKYYLRLKVVVNNPLADSTYVNEAYHTIPENLKINIVDYWDKVLASTQVELTGSGSQITNTVLLEYDSRPSFWGSMSSLRGNWGDGWKGVISKKTDGQISEFTYTLTRKTLRPYAKVIINDNQNAEGLRDTTEVDVRFFADGLVDYTLPVKVNATSATATGYNNEDYLPCYDLDGNVINYQTEATGLPAAYVLNKEKCAVKNAPEVWNSVYIEATCEYDLLTRPVTVDVVWDDSRDQGRSRPSNVILTMYCDGEVLGSQEVSSATGWKATWNAPVYNENGELCQYTVTQNEQQIYTTRIAENPPIDGNDPVTEAGKPETAEDDTYSFTVTNTLQEDWNYYLDLVWDTTNAAERYDRYEISQNDTQLRSMTYKLTINVNAAKYKAGDLEVRLPYAHVVTNRLNQSNSKPVPPTAIAVPKSPAYNINNAFNYYIDDMGTPSDISDDELVFVNWRDIEDSLNQTIEVKYEFYPAYLVDTYRYQWQAVGHGIKYEVIDGEEVKAAQEEIQYSPAITYGIDTGIAPSGWTLSAGRFNESPTSTWVRELTNAGYYDPENYYYVMATYTLDGSRFNQHGKMVVELTAYDDAEIIPLQANTVHRGGSYSWSVTGNNNLSADGMVISSSSQIEAPINSTEAVSGGFRYVIRYPKPQELDENGCFTGKLSAKASFICNNEHENDKVEPYDYNDVISDEDEISFVWQPPVEWEYTGDVWNTYKTAGSISNYPVTRVELGMPLNITNYTVETVFNGVREQHRPFQIEAFDDALFAQGMIDGTISDPVRLTEEDYELRLRYFSVSWHDYDDNGNYIYTNIPYGTYKIQAKTSLDGEWFTIETVELTENSVTAGASNYRVTYDASLYADKGYVGYRMLTPEGLEGSIRTYLQFDAYFYGDSPVLQELARQDMTIVYITNWCATKFYLEDENGVYQWVNDYPYCYYDGPGDAQLAVEDMAREGAYMRRNRTTHSGGELSQQSYISKSISSQVNNTVDGTVDVQFYLRGYEYLGSDAFPDYAKAMSWQYGVFYDLLPLGYTYDASKAVQVFDANGSRDGDDKGTCSLVKVEVEDNYKDTKRQMIRFYVKYDGEEGTNLDGFYRNYPNYEYASGFVVKFWAKAPWEQLSLFPYGYNVVGLQEGSVDEATGEIVYGGENNLIAKGREDNGGIFTVTHGTNVQAAMSDLNGDGITTGIQDTLTSSVYINPDFVSAYQIGLAKFVKANSGIWQSHDVAYLGGEYRYKIRLTLGDGGTTQDLVLFDVLEDAANTEAAMGEVFWKGKFRGVDTSIPTLQGIVPKVYYSTVQGLDSNTFTGKDDLTNEEIWSATPPQDLDTVTALAFDLTTSAAGGNFVFNKAMTTEVEIIMEAPELLPREELAYNRSSYGATYKASSSAQATSSHNIGHRVTVALYDEKDFEFIKLGEMEDADPVGLSGVEFTLYKCSHTHVYTCTSGCHTHTGTPGEQDACWTTVIGSATSGEDGLVCFESLTNGMYALVETGTKDGYVPLEDMWWTFEVDASTIGGITDPVNAGTGENHVSITKDQNGRKLLNSRLKTSISVEKVWTGEVAGVQTRPASIKLDLYRNEQLYRKGVEVTPDADGLWSYTFEDLMLTDPEGETYTYRVEEQPVPGYASQVDDSGDPVVIINTCLGQLEISKLVVDGDESKAFTFTVALIGTGTPITGDYTVYRTDARGSVTTETVTAAGSSLTVTAAHGESVRIVGLPVGASYTVTEQAEGGYTPAVTAGAVSGTVQAQTLHTVTFTNTYDASGEWNPVASKLVNGQPARADEVFTFLLTSGTDTPEVRQEVTNNGGSIAFEAVPYGLADVGMTYTYTIEEISTQETGYTLDERVYTVTVQITDNGDGTLTATPSYSVDGQGAEGVVFENEYEATGELTLEAVKTVNGQTPREDQRFTFELTGPGDGLPQTVTNNGSQILFDPITYDLEDLEGSPYTYTVKETSLSGNGYTVDDTVYTVFVWLEDNKDGTLKVTKQIYANGSPVEAIAFDNTYEATGEITLEAVKTVNGQPPREDQVYTFLLESGEGTPTVSQEKSNQLGSVVFDTLTYTYEDAGNTYTYTVSETTASEGDLVADDTIYTVNVEIIDNRDGTLTVTPAYLKGNKAAEEIAFNNILHAPLTILKTVTGPDTEETFPFTIRLYDENQAEATGTFTYTGDLTGQLSSGDVIRLGQNQSITIIDLLPGMSYSVEEEPGVRYTGTVNGQQQTVVTGQSAEGGNAIAFDNVLVTTGLSVTKQWDGAHGGSIQLVLYANGVKLENQPVPSQDGDTYSYTNLPKYDLNGSEIVYSVKEKYMDGYLTIYSNVSPHKSETDQVYNGGTIINREVVTFRIRKEWNGLGDQPAPPIKLTLYCNGTVYNRQQPAPDAHGWYVYSNLPKYVGGELARYTIEEEAMAGFDTYYYASNGEEIEIGVNGGRIVNVKIPDTGDKQPVVLWQALMGMAAIAVIGMIALMKQRRRG